MSDTGKYSNHPVDVTLSGNTYRLNGMGLGAITAEAANHVMDERLAYPRQQMDAAGIEGSDRVSFLLQWLDKNPEPTERELESMVAEYITTDRGLFRLTAWGISEQLDISKEDAGDMLVDANIDELFMVSQVIFGGLLNKVKRGANNTPSKKPRKRQKKR
jgi:hypothetical protein